jgi:hypothetical protein
VLRETTRPLSDAERAELERRAQWKVNEDLGGAITFFCVLGVFGGTLGSCASARVPHALPIALGLSFVLWLFAARTNLRARLAEKTAYRRDLAKGEARVLHVEDADVAIRKERGSEGPTLVMKVSEQQVLFLGGQWLLDDALYGDGVGGGGDGDGDGDAFDEKHLNGLPDPHGFPAKSFELAFAPASRVVFAIRVLGPYADGRHVPADAVAIEDLAPFELVDIDHPAVRGAFSGKASTRARPAR